MERSRSGAREPAGAGLERILFTPNFASREEYRVLAAGVHVTRCAASDR
ncbi:MAG: hypothetical protein R3F08_10705 [Dokdonella sp.]